MHLVNSVHFVESHFVELCLVKKYSDWLNNAKSPDGYAVSSGRPTNTKASDGYTMGTSGGRPRSL